MNTTLPTQRMHHNHVTQKDIGQWDCDACNAVRPEVMTPEFGMSGHRWLLANGIIPMYGNW